jgi:predicted pore-forming effector associated with SMODS systems
MARRHTVERRLPGHVAQPGPGLLTVSKGAQVQLRAQVVLTIGLAAIVWSASLLMLGEALSWRMLAPFGITISAVTLTAFLFVQHAWRWWIFSKWLVQRPDLSGTWRCRLTSSYRLDGKPVEKTVYVVIRQTLVSLSFRLYTDRARSTSIAENLAKNGGGLFTLMIAYQNVPRVEDRGRETEIHYGSTLFMHIDYESKRIEGHYWTDRSTNGSLVLLERRAAQVASFEDAENLFTAADGS